MRRLSIILPYFLVFLIFFLPAVDTDLGWHLRYGEHFLDTGQIMRTNELTFLLPDYDWTHSYSAYQTLTAGIYRLGGLLGLALAYGVLGALIWLVFDLLTKKTRPLNLLVFLGSVWLGWGVLRLGWRAQILSHLGLLLSLLILEGTRKSLRWLLVFPLLILLWANTHGGFVLGGVVLGAVVLQELVSKNWRQSLQFVTVGGLSVAITFLNPFGFDIYREVWHQTTYPNNQLIAEWVAPPFLMQALVVVLALVVIGLIVSASVRRKVFWAGLVLLFAVMALGAHRHLSFFGLVVGLAPLHSLRQPLSAWLSNIKPPRLDVLWPMGLTVGILVVVIIRVPTTVAVSTQWDKYCTAAQIRYPCKAAVWLKQNPLEVTNIFNAYEWGGFLEWQLPEYKFFVDGRMPAWTRPSPYTIYLELIQAKGNYQQRLDGYGAEALFIQAGTFLDLKLQEEDAVWQEVYRDKRAVVYERQDL